MGDRAPPSVDPGFNRRAQRRPPFQVLFFAVRRVAGRQWRHPETGADQRPAGNDVRQEQGVGSQGSGGPGQEARLGRTASGTVAEAETGPRKTVDADQVSRVLVRIFAKFFFDFKLHMKMGGELSLPKTLR